MSTVASEEVIGIVEDIKDNGIGKGSGLYIGGHKYGVYDPVSSGLDKIAVGTTVSLRYKLMPKGGIDYKNVQGRVTTVAAGTAPTAAPAAAPAGGGKGGHRRNGEAGGFPIDARAYERALDRRNALTCAVTFCERKGLDADEVIELARKFEAYSCGDDIALADQTLAFLEESDADIEH